MNIELSIKNIKEAEYQSKSNDKTLILIFLNEKNISIAAKVFFVVAMYAYFFDLGEIRLYKNRRSHRPRKRVLFSLTILDKVFALFENIMKSFLDRELISESEFCRYEECRFYEIIYLVLFYLKVSKIDSHSPNIWGNGDDGYTLPKNLIKHIEEKGLNAKMFFNV